MMQEVPKARLDPAAEGDEPGLATPVELEFMVDASPLYSYWVGDIDGRDGYYLVEPSSLAAAVRKMKATLPTITKTLELDRIYNKLVRIIEQGQGHSGPRARAHTVASAAASLEVSPTRVRQLISAGMIDARKDPHGEWIIDETEIQRRLAERMAGV